MPHYSGDSLDVPKNQTLQPLWSRRRGGWVGGITEFAFVQSRKDTLANYSWKTTQSPKAIWMDPPRWDDGTTVDFRTRGHRRKISKQLISCWPFLNVSKYISRQKLDCNLQSISDACTHISYNVSYKAHSWDVPTAVLKFPFSPNAAGIMACNFFHHQLQRNEILQKAVGQFRFLSHAVGGIHVSLDSVSETSLVSPRASFFFVVYKSITLLMRRRIHFRTLAIDR